MLPMHGKPGAKILDTMANPWYPACNRSSYNFVMDTPPSNSREQRNKAEKQRRDKLNAYIAELARLVPMVSRSAKRMDKTSILRLTATFLRINQTLMNSNSSANMNFPKHVDQFLLEQLVCEQMGGFLLIVLPTGKIVFVSHTIENLLGHLQTDLMGQSLFNITSSDDHERLRTYLQCIGAVEHDWTKYFGVRLRRAGPRSESAVFEPAKMMGVHRQAGGAGVGGAGLGGAGQVDGGASPASSRSSTTSSVGCSNNDMIVLFVKICQPEPLVDRLIEASKEEYVTRHLIDGKIIGCDQRISIIAGYMREEVTGHSAFKYMHRDDMRWVMIALRQMYDRGESRGSSCYRLQSRNGMFIYLRTCGFLEIDDQGTVESFICVNSLVDEREGLDLIEEMKRKYSAIINSTYTLGEDNENTPQAPIDLVEDPVQVDQAVAQLMRNLPSPGSDNRSTPSPLVHHENQDYPNHLTNNTEKNYVTESPNNKYQVRLKTAPVAAPVKRQSSVDSPPYENFNKRPRTLTQPCHRPTTKPYSQRAAVSPIITDIKNQPEKSPARTTDNFELEKIYHVQ
ncbi:unnamed protein product [Phaedon cochleariae]|uniref:Methoprene-tolerant protein n=1 Tax=Phaedon cochleariae TaxID=80249 RepID=A0A9P0GTU2_PHACE|nr:unnamed protein product [Phaedon cochleariae]